jgi:hypothetical protein
MSTADEVIELQAGGLLVSPDPLFNSRRAQVVALAARHAVPAIYPWGEFAAVGGLISYGPSLSAALRQVGIYTGKILKAPSRPSSRRGSSWSSTSRRRRRLASRSRP